MKQQTLTQGNILKSLIAFAFPVLLALFLQAMYGAADLIIVGQFAGTGEQSGVASGSQLFNMVTMAITGLTMGVTVFAAVGVAEKAVIFLMLVGSSYMQSISAFVAQNNGAGQYDRSKKALFYGIETALAAGIVTGALAYFGGGVLASIFSKEPAVIAAARTYLQGYAIDCVFTAIFFCFVGYFNGCGKTIFVMVQGLVGAFCVRVPAVFLLSRLEDVSLFHIALATPLSSLVQIFLCLWAYRLYRRAPEKLR